MTDETQDVDQSTEETKTYTQAQLDEILNEQVGGLKAKVEELLTEKKTASQIAKEEKAERLRLEQETAKKSGEFESFEKTLRGEFDSEREELTGKLSALQSRVLGSKNESVISSLSSEFLSNDASEILQHYVKTEFDGDDVVTKYVDGKGELITTDKDKFIKWMSEHKTLSLLMKSNTATGGGAGGSKTPISGADGGAKPKSGRTSAYLSTVS